MTASNNASIFCISFLSISFFIISTCSIQAQQVCLNDTIVTTDIQKCFYAFDNVIYDPAINGSPDVSSGYNLPIGTTIVIWTYTDSEGMSTICNQMITVVFNFDNDGILDSEDNCSSVFNPTQIDSNGDGIGDACQPEINECGNKDIMITLDRSGSVGAAGWAQAVGFAKDLIDTLITIDSTNTNRYAISSFATDTLLAHGFDDDQSLDSILASIDSIDYVGGWTHTKDAVQQSINTYLNQTSGDNIRVNLLVTDGNPFPSSSQSPCPLANTLNINDINMKIIGVGNSFNPNLISCIVQDQNYDIFYVSAYDELDLTILAVLGTIYYDLDDDGILDCLQGGGYDDDGDGWRNNYYSDPPYSDCNDANPDIYPGAIEICDGKDNNCNGLIDEGFNADCTPIDFVSNVLENGNLSLRYFIENTCKDTITFVPFLTDSTITLTGDPFNVYRDVVIQGLGIDHLTVNADYLSQAFIINPNTHVSLFDLKLDKGLNAINGGSILNYGDLSLDSISLKVDLINPISITNHGVLNIANIVEIKE